MRQFICVVSRVVVWMAPIVALLAAVVPLRARAEATAHYWRSRLFFIPYQPNLNDPRAGSIDKVQLLVAHNGAQQWSVLQEAESHVRGFSYHAKADGEYAFALRMSDKQGNVWPEQVGPPLLRIIVDTQVPTLRLNASLDASGHATLRYEARDLKLKAESLRLEVQTGDQWQRLTHGPPDLNQPDRLVGSVAWSPSSTSAVHIRGTIEDAAGNVANANAEVLLNGPTLGSPFGPRLNAPDVGRPSPSGPLAWQDANRDESTTRDSLGADVQWPTNGALAEAGNQSDEIPYGVAAQSVAASTGSDRAAGTSATVDPFASRTMPGFDDGARLRAQFATGEPLERQTPGQDRSSDTESAPSLLSGGQANSDGDAPYAADGWASRRAAAYAEATIWVNSLTFDVDYDIQTVGPWGVARVELWGTRDGGHTWVSLGVDLDNRSPIRVTVPDAGVYGFRILVDGGNGAAAPTPRPGEAAELTVGVDLQAPRAQLRDAELGAGTLAGHVIVRWAAEDENLAPRPVGLYYSAAADGPWTTIATDLDNTGEYPWRLGREAPPRVFLRLEVRDHAGNVEVQQSPAPIDLNVPRPAGRLRSVRPVEDAPSRYRTARGARPAGG